MTSRPRRAFFRAPLGVVATQRRDARPPSGQSALYPHGCAPETRFRSTASGAARRATAPVECPDCVTVLRRARDADLPDNEHWRAGFGCRTNAGGVAGSA